MYDFIFESDRLLDGLIPFPSDKFDLVINNQVMEHCPDLDFVLKEIHRVLKPGGKVLSLFPAKTVWREGHSGIPFLHRFPKKSLTRVYYAMFFRKCGFGYHTKNKTNYMWSSDFCEWLDKWTFYRSYEEIRQTYEKYFIDLRHIEDRWLDERLGGPNFMTKSVPKGLKRIIVLKFAGLVFVCSKLPKVNG